MPDSPPPDPIRAARDEVARGDVRPATTLPAGERAGDVIDRYKLLERIGEGGMGTVWMAEQREPVKRRVALKIIKLGMDTRQVIARFEAERQALAMMDHPHIAKVLDGGATETGRPYFAMEYIRGIPILEYCDQEKIDTKARLELFAKVCHAIQHAHQKGIIHRDIKPSNVLVTLHDSVPVPKVIDFGIAKATNSELTAKTLFTEHRQMVGTPTYMSPEQAEMSGLDIDTRADIYSLGVLLYELLTGTTPFDMKQLLSKGFAEMMRAIREDEPHKPSTRISSLGGTGTRTALLRKVDANKLSSLLRGDLDWIVMRCLEKDRNRRYETANGLAADIRRHLNDEPISAGAPSASYKLRKFLRRNRRQVIAAGAVVAALLCGVVAFAWQATEARNQRDHAVAAQRAEAEQRQLAEVAKIEAEAQRARAKEQEAEARRQEAEAKAQEAEAKQQAAIAEAVAKFQTDMLAAVDPNQLPKDPQTGEPLKDAVTVVQAMQAAVKVLDEGALEDQPLVEANVRSAIGSTLLTLGRFAEAEPNLREALALRRAALPAGHPDIAFCLHRLGAFLRHLNKLAEAELLLREALEIRRATLPAAHPEIANDLNSIAVLLQAQSKFDEAEALFLEALEIWRASLPAGHPNIAYGLNNLASLLAAQSKFAAAEPHMREALEIWRATYPAGHPAIGLGMNNLAALLTQQNKLAEAEPLLREALEIRRAALPAAHPEIAISMSNLASLLKDQNRLAEAEPLLREALEMHRAALPAGHPNLAIGLQNLASLLKDQNKLAEAEPLLRESLEILRAAYPAGHPKLVSGLNTLAIVYEEMGRREEALPLLRELLAAARATLPKDSAELAGRLAQHSLTLIGLKAWDEAEPLLRECLAIREKAPEDWTTFNTRSLLGGALLGQNELAEAEPLLLDGYRGIKEREAAIPPEGKVRIPEALERLVKLYEAKGNEPEAAAWRNKLEAARTAMPAPATDGGK